MSDEPTSDVQHDSADDLVAAALILLLYVKGASIVDFHAEAKIDEWITRYDRFSRGAHA